MLKLLLFVLPLGLDTFAVAAALGLSKPSPKERLRVSLLLSSFEAAMPLVGLLLGHALGDAIGRVADYIAIAVLGLLGVWLLLDNEQAERRRVERLSTGHGLALLVLGISVSLDELAMGFTIGLLRTPIWAAIALIGGQAFLVAQLGLRIGTRLSEDVREGAERLAGVALLGIGLLLLTQKLT